MNFKKWLISEEIYSQNKTATVYHRTCGGCNEYRSIKAVSGILTRNYKIGDGCWYGCGLYTTYKIESQFTEYMQAYGQAVVKFKVTDLEKYLVFELSEAKKIHGNDYKISDQFKKLGLLNKPKVDESKLKEYDERQEKENYSSVLAKEFYDQNKWIENSVKGMIYYGKNDGYCLVKYEPVQDGTITMLAYAVAKYDDMKKMQELKNTKSENWITSTYKASVKSIYKSPIENRKKYSFGDNEKIIDQLLNSKNLEMTAKYLGLDMNKIYSGDIDYLITAATDKDKMMEVIIKYKTNFSRNDSLTFIQYATDKDKVSELIIKYKKELDPGQAASLLAWPDDLTDKNKIAELIIEKPSIENPSSKEIFYNSDVVALLNAATDKDKMAEAIVKKKPELDDANIVALINAATNKDKIVEAIVKKKPEISNKNLSNVLNAVTEKDKIVELIIEKKPELKNDDVSSLIAVSINKDKIAKLIIEKKPELSDTNVSYLLSYATNADEIADLIIENKTELSDTNVENLLHYTNDKDKFAKIIINRKSELSNINVFHLIQYAINKNKIAERLQKETDNISKLSRIMLLDLIHISNDKKQLAQIINKYHTKKTPEFQEILDKYLTQTIAAK